MYVCIYDCIWFCEHERIYTRLLNVNYLGKRYFFYGVYIETALLNSPSYIKSYVLTYGTYVYKEINESSTIGLNTREHHLQCGLINGGPWSCAVWQPYVKGWSLKTDMIVSGCYLCNHKDLFAVVNRKHIFPIVTFYH